MIKNKTVMEKEIKINVPEGYEIDKENSTFECIKFKPVVKRWRDENHKISGWWIDEVGIIYGNDKPIYCSTFKQYFATEKQAKSALAMAQISQIMANDERFGGIVTDEEWRNRNIDKYCFYKAKGEIRSDIFDSSYHFLAFHTAMQETLFMEENEDLVKDYLMID